jgi:hypothetical protein
MPLATLLIAVGLAAAQATYRGHVGRVAHAAIRLAFASALLASASGLFLLFDLGQFAADLSFFTFLAAFGAALFFAGLFAAGTLRNRALSPVAAVPLVLGGLVTALFVLREFLSDFGANGLEQMLGILVLLIAAAGFALLGATLQAPQAAVEVVPDTS